MEEVENVKNVANALKDQANQFSSTCSKLAEVFKNIATNIDTTDSNLKNDIANYEYYYNELAAKSYGVFEEYSNSIISWADFTANLEAETSSKLQQITSGLNDISGLINKLKE